LLETVLHLFAGQALRWLSPGELDDVFDCRRRGGFIRRGDFYLQNLSRLIGEINGANLSAERFAR
jgi:hypothetical protein